MATLQVTDKHIIVRDSFFIKDRIKSVGEFKFDKENKIWKARFDYATLYHLAEAVGSENMHMDGQTKQYVQQAKQFEDQRLARVLKLAQIRDEQSVDLSGYEFDPGITPYKHQSVALTFMKYTPVCNYFADPGCGKTFVGIHWLDAVSKKVGPGFRALIVAPVNVIPGAWRDDLKRFKPNIPFQILPRSSVKAAQVLAADDRKAIPNKVFLVNYEMAWRIKDVLKQFGFNLMILDESSKIKSWKAKVTQAMIEIGDLVRYKMVLTGTPAIRTELYYFPQIRFLSKRVFGSNFYRFRQQYFIPPMYGQFDWAFNHELEEGFQKKVYTYGLRHRAEDCLDLPDQIHHNRTVVMTGKPWLIYNQVLKDAVLELPWKDLVTGNKCELPMANTLAALVKARQVLGGFVKVNTVEQGKEIWHEYHTLKLQELKELVENLGDTPILIWAAFRKEIEAIHSMFPGSVTAYGGTKDTDKSIEDFKSGRAKILIAHTKSIGHGVTLVNCHNAIYYSLDYDPELNLQSIKRIYRIGQKETTHYWYLIAEGPNGEVTLDKSIKAASDGHVDESIQLLDSIVSEIRAADLKALEANLDPEDEGSGADEELPEEQ
jgi:SNF2 family DNA or RNA helicase